MATNIKLKKSAVVGKVPLTTDLEYGEIAINYADGLLFFKNSSNTVQSISATPVGVDSSAVFGIIDQTYINSLDVNAGTLDGQDGTYFLNYNNFTNTPSIPDSAFVSNIASNTVGPTDSASITAIVDSAFVERLVKEDYIATIVDSAYVAVKLGDGFNNFGTVAVVGDLSIDATTGGDTITLQGGTGVDISSDVGNKRITISATPSTVYDFGTIIAPVQFTLDMGAI